MSVPTVDSVAAVVRTLVPEPVNINIPMEHFLQEAIHLAHWARGDHEVLVALRFNMRLIDELPLRVAVARYAESEWNAVRFSRDPLGAGWDSHGRKVSEHRDEMLRVLRFAYRTEESLLARVNKIGKSTTPAEMVQELSSIAMLARSYPGPLIAIHFDMRKLAETESLVRETSAMLGAFSSERSTQNAKKLFRDQAVWYVKQAVDEIRRAGHYINATKPERLKGYFSFHGEKKNAHLRGFEHRGHFSH